ncbi:MAG: hypothetical protein KIT62_17955 [Cyclobacteriaceae bacterium]|nr:hypothetical protein [Cyclobacteriaceae bacterium]
MLVAAIILVTAALLVFLVYQLKASLIKTYKDKHDYINTNEIKWLKWVFALIGVAAACAINLYGKDEIGGPGVSFFVRLFFSIAGATLVIYIASLVLEYYYPTRLHKKLRKLRYAPRTSTQGNKMKLLSEDEEDVHLNEGMQAEENIFSIDYDVWIDEKTQEVRIEKYQGHLISLQCNNCGFYTMRVQREEIVERNEDGTPKELLKHYQCSYCKNIRATQFSINRKESEDYKHVKPKYRKNSKNIELIRIDIHSTLGGKKSFEFQSVEEVQKFLNEFDFDKVA